LEESANSRATKVMQVIVRHHMGLILKMFLWGSLIRPARLTTRSKQASPRLGVVALQL
jgi:hypothetical protein